MWGDIKRINFENNLPHINKNAFSTGLTEIYNDSILSEHEKLDQIATKISSVAEIMQLLKTKEITIRNGYNVKKKKKKKENKYGMKMSV